MQFASEIDCTNHTPLIIVKFPSLQPPSQNLDQRGIDANSEWKFIT